MHDSQSPGEAYFDRQFVAIERRIKAAAERHRKRKAWTIAGTVAAVSVALTGGAVAVIQATQTEKSISLCFEAPSVSSRNTDVGGGDVDSLPAMPDRVRLAEEQCASAWRIGVFHSSGPADGADHPVPLLFTCLLADGRLGVFPVTPDVSCETLGLREP